jgi:replicative DNA helicase
LGAQVWSNDSVADELFSVGQALDDADDALLSGRQAASRVYATGFGLLDTYLGGGLRSGELCLLGGPQGLGKTAWVLQVARHVANVGEAAVVMSYEHDATTLLERLITIEAGDTFGVDGTPLRRVRDALEGAGPRQSTLQERLEPTVGGADAVAALRIYGHRLLLHRFSGTATGIAEIRRCVESAIEPVVPLEDTPLLSDEVMIYLRDLTSVQSGVEGRIAAK